MQDQIHDMDGSVQANTVLVSPNTEFMTQIAQLMAIMG